MDSGEEPVDNSARFRACVVADHECIVQVAGMVEYLEKEGEPLDEYDGDGSTWVRLISEHCSLCHV